MSYKTNPKVYLDVQIGASEAGRIIFELFMDLTPKTAENFRGLCTGEYGKVGDVRLHYLNSKFHRICDNFVIQGGDITGGGGTGGFSIYGRTFIDENFARRHSCAGLLSMANCGRNSNSSQFFITLKACPHLDGKHVVFGQVIDGMETVRKMAKVPVDKMDKPKIPIIILDCGEVGDFKAFLKHDPFKKSVFDQIRQRKENIIREQHKIRKLLEQGIDPNAAYENKTKLEKCDEELKQLEIEEAEYLENHPEEKERQDKLAQSGQPAIAEPEVEPVSVSENLKNTLKPAQLDRLLEMKTKLNQARVLNSKAVLFEEMQQNDINYHKAMKKEEWLGKRKHLEEELKAKGINEDKLYLNRTCGNKEETDNGKDAFGWNVFTHEGVYKAYYRRCAEHPIDKEKYEKDKNSFPSPLDKPSDEALNRLAADVEKQIEKRGKFSRTRLPAEGEIVDYVNDRNRVFNNKVNRYFGKYAQGIKTALEMANQKETK